MLEITKPFIRAIRQRNMHYEIQTLPDGCDRILIPFSGESPMFVHVILNEEQSVLSVQIYDLVKIPDPLIALTTTNRLNGEYRFVKFYLEPESQSVHMRADAVIIEETASFVGIQLLKSCLTIHKAVMPLLLSAAQQRR